ncbi:hypothetical protein IC232_29525 [Microvirga sp. BT688]|uniref:hypothetical protein n=1 Tax=Microvirga sp. TaxID=1873136 RepID=UPI0016882C29|nr:hypothetical protein [Microvirga sp.]MBD2750785.1 hypothetical protein [Microvirga sp.]
MVYTLSSGVSTSLNETHNFEAIFRIAATNHLMLVRFRSQGCPAVAVDWEHDEYTSDGRLVARYQSFERLCPSGERQNGWRKFDRTGQLVSETDNLC